MEGRARARPVQVSHSAAEGIGRPGGGVSTRQAKAPLRYNPLRVLRPLRLIPEFQDSQRPLQVVESRVITI